MNLPIIVEGDVSQSEASYLTIHIEPLEAKLLCSPSHIFLPPLPTSKAFAIDLELTLNLLEGEFVLGSVGFAAWKNLGIAKLPFNVTLPDGKSKNDKLIPWVILKSSFIQSMHFFVLEFMRNAVSQKLRVQIQIQSKQPFAISNRPQPPSLVFTAKSSNSDFKNLVYSCCIPFIISIDDSLLSLVHFNQLADKNLISINSLLDYHQAFDDRMTTVIETWLRHHSFPGVVHGLSFPSDFQRYKVNRINVLR